ncbi:Hsp70 family protein [Mycobacterium sp. PSTR-4-N]|uniref:Hsp70 family protein n=1 Tax=Mycobacterium sp. PSTR-4-N TaxID=2917745 RepID=UPI00272AEBF3|nr:Hsp70 family protein [Mycobacterium sp. PSTR-4-N]
MRTSVGISLGSANLVAVAGGRPVVRPAAVTVRPGVTMTGFVERVGDPVPMLATDGSAHRADRLAAAAIEAATRQASPRYRPELGAVAVPGHWSDTAVAALRDAAPHLVIVPDSTAALTAIAAGPGLPTRGVVLLCDFGAGGTSITLADAGTGFAAIGPTVRCDDFSGDLVDQALLRHVLDGLNLDPAGTSAVASLHDLRAESRAAKERLSQVTATALVGARGPVRVTRGELEALIAEPLDRLVAVILDVVHRARVAPAAVITVGGGARIPLVTQRLSDALRCPVRTTAHPQIAAASGAELLARRSVDQQAATVAVPAPDTVLAPALAWSAEDIDAEETQFAIPAAEGGADTGAARPAVHFTPPADDETPAKKRAAAPVWLAGAACAAAIATAAVLLTTQIARSDETTPASGISTPVAMHALEPSVAPPADTVTQTVRAAPAPQQAAVQAAPAPAAPQGQVVAKEAAPAPAPAAPAPAPAPAAPAPAPAPAAPAPVWPRIPLPQFTFPAPTPKPSPTPAPSSTPEPTPTPTSEAPTSEAPTQTSEPAPTSEAPSSEAPATTTAPEVEPTTASPSPSPSPSA